MKTTSIRRALLSLVSALFVLSISNATAQTPVITTYTPDPPHDGYFAPKIDLCTVQNSCSNLTTIQFDIFYDVVFDLADYTVDGLWFSTDNQAIVDIDSYPSENRVHVTLTRDQGVTGGGTFMTFPGIGIVDDSDPKRSEETFALQAYPNPASSVSHFRITQPVQNAILVDLQGRILWQDEDLAAGEYTIPVHDFPAGLYLLKVQRDNLSAMSKVLVGSN
jgi:hypothetical protein